MEGKRSGQKIVFVVVILSLVVVVWILSNNAITTQQSGESMEEFTRRHQEATARLEAQTDAIRSVDDKNKANGCNRR